MLSMKAKYALRALTTLARHTPDTLPAREIAVEARVPEKFLEAILLELKRHGFVESRKGKGGGYFLRREPSEITFGSVIRVLEGPLAAVPCVSQTAYMKCVECPVAVAWGVRVAMKEVRDATARILDNTTLADINGQIARRPKKRASKTARV